MPAIKAVIPAAGRGTRLLPFTLAAPKELLPVRGKPMIHLAVAEAAAAGIVNLLLPFQALIRERRNLAVLLEGRAMDFGAWPGYEYFRGN